MKVGIIAIAKDEDKYIEEWYHWHIDRGFDHIFLIDNNDPDKKLKLSFPKMTVSHLNGYDITDEKSKQIQIGNALYKNFIVPQGFDYFIFLDLDEFIDLKNPLYENNIKKYIECKISENPDWSFSKISWEVYDDNGYIYENDLPSEKITECYTHIQTLYLWDNTYNFAFEYKSIIKTIPSQNYIYTSGINGPERDWDSYHKTSNYEDRKDISIRHYRFKCLETYLKHKVNNQIFTWNIWVWTPEKIIFNYFLINEITDEKIKAMKELLNKYNITYNKEALEILEFINTYKNPNRLLYFLKKSL